MMKLSAISSFIFLVASVAGINAAFENRILSTGSEECDPGQFPNLVSISVNEEHLCGGWIYNERHVVTAAECVRDLPVSAITITVGQLSLNAPDPYEVRYNVLRVELYTADGGYNETTGIHNIAILQTVTSIDFTNPSQVNFLYYDEFSTTEVAVIAGWGQGSQGGGPSLLCRTANIRLAPIETCRASFGELFNPIYQLCTTLEEMANACKGDEGGPVIQIIQGRLVVTGMVTKVVSGCNPYTSAGMANIASYYRWLTQTAGSQPTNVFEAHQ